MRGSWKPADLVVLDGVERDGAAGEGDGGLLEDVEADDRVGREVADRVDRVAVDDARDDVDVVEVEPEGELLVTRERRDVDLRQRLPQPLQRGALAGLEAAVVHAVRGVVVGGEEAVPIGVVGLHGGRGRGGERDDGDEGGEQRSAHRAEIVGARSSFVWAAERVGSATDGVVAGSPGLQTGLLARTMPRCSAAAFRAARRWRGAWRRGRRRPGAATLPRRRRRGRSNTAPGAGRSCAVSTRRRATR